MLETAKQIIFIIILDLPGHIKSQNKNNIFKNVNTILFIGN